MKRNILFILLFLCPLIMYSQNIRAIEKDNVKTMMVTDKNGKASTSDYTTPSGKISDFWIKSKSLSDNNQNPSIQFRDNKENTFSLTINFLSDFSYANVIITNSDTVYYGGDMNWLTTATCQIDIPEGEYEIIAISYKVFETTPIVSFVSFHNYMLNSDNTLDVDFNQMAINRIESNFVDELGIPFPSDDNTIRQGITMIFPSSLKSSTYGFSVLGGHPLFMLSDFNPEYSFFSEFIYAKPNDCYATYSQTIAGINNDTVFLNQGTDYNILKTALKAKPNAESMYLTFGSTDIVGSRLVLGVSTGFNEKYPVQHGDTLNLFLNNTLVSLADSNKMAFCPWVFFWQKPDEGKASYEPIIKAPSPLVMNADSIILLEFGAHIDSPNLILKSGESFPLGGTVPHIQAWGLNNYNQNTVFGNITMLIGQHSENRETDGNYCTYRIIHDDQVIDSGNLADFSNIFTQVGPETYTWELINPNYKVYQKQGKAMLTSTFDLGNEDPNFPVFTSFRVFDNNNTIGDELIHHESASILFSTFDFVQDYMIFEEPSSVKAYYNIDGEEGWNELDITDHPALYDLYIYGYFYSCDLTSVLAQFDNIGYINFKIDVSDLAGNTTSQTWSPLAFVSHPLVIQPSVSLSTQSMTVAPNPVNGHCVIGFNLPEAAQSELMVFDIKGKLVENILSSKLDAGNHQISWSPSPSLSKGTYLIKLITAKGIKTSKIFIQ